MSASGIATLWLRGFGGNAGDPGGGNGAVACGCACASNHVVVTMVDGTLAASGARVAMSGATGCGAFGEPALHACSHATTMALVRLVEPSLVVVFVGDVLIACCSLAFTGYRYIFGCVEQFQR